MSVTSYERGLSGKRVVCLGGTSGIGYAVAERSANEGASIVVVSSRQEKVDRAISRLNHGTEGYAVDLTNEAQVRQLFIDIGQFDHLVFSAGDPLPPATLSTLDVDAARQLFDLRYWGSLMAVKYGSDHIKEGERHPGGSSWRTGGCRRGGSLFDARTILNRTGHCPGRRLSIGLSSA